MQRKSGNVEASPGHSPQRIGQDFATRRDRVTRRARSFGDHLVVRAKLVPPGPRSELLRRDRLASRLARVAEYPLTLVKADAGYGKTTALASLEGRFPKRFYWYSLSSADADPLVFLLHLLAAFRHTHPTCGDRALALLEREGGAAKHWAAAVDALTNDLFEALHDDAVLVLDDYHSVEGRDVDAITDRLVEHMPATLHLVIATRHAPAMPRLARRRALGEVLDLTRTDLAFTGAEVEALFQGYGLPLGDGQADELVAETEGWPIALQMVWQRLRAGDSDPLGKLLQRLPDNLDGLFAYLAEEVLAEQSPGVQEFLLQSSVLRRMDAGICDQLLHRQDSEARLREIEDRSLFMTSLGAGTYRYHPLFHDFLAHRASQWSATGWRRLHRRASTLYRRRGEGEEAIHHALAARDHRRASALLREAATDMIQAGRYETLAGWLDSIPEPILGKYPELLRARGDVARLLSRFDLALAAYTSAEERFAMSGDRQGQSRALEGAALVYLDTVQPRHAEPLLRRALDLTEPEDRQRRERLQLLFAENWANRGELTRAERLQRAVRRRQGRPEPDIDPRIYVREGRLGEARTLAERQLRSEQAETGHGVPRSHRESTAVLAWISAFTGDAEGARAYAERALHRGRELRAPIVEVVALSRLGHGWLSGTDADPKRAMDYYREALALADGLHVARFRVESLLGHVVAYGLEGRIVLAHEAARDALAILDDAGDHYLASVVWLALGAAGVLARHPEATVWIDAGADLAERCGDRYGACLADLWRAHLAVGQQDWDGFDAPAGRALRAASAHDLGFLFTSHPLLGIKQASDLEMLLQAALRRGIEPRLALYFLRQLAPDAADLYTGSASSSPPLFVRALGQFRVWRDGREIPTSAWSRGKALQLFQFLLDQTGRAVHREQVQEALWPDARPGASALGLRVALNALQRTLEPERPKEAEPRFVHRQGASLILEADLVRLDVDDLVEAVRQGHAKEAARQPEAALDSYRRALALYSGDYLEGLVYEEWAAERRRELLDLYLKAAERTAGLLVERGAYEEAQDICQQILVRDRCWEPAYALLMRAQAALGNRSLALRTFERCRQHLFEDLGIEPSPALIELRLSLSRVRTSYPTASTGRL